MDNQDGTPGLGGAKPKDKTVAVLLAVFLAFFTWCYTYKKDSRKFWLNLGLSVVSFGLWGPVAWIWAIVEAARRPREFYTTFNQPVPDQASSSSARAEAAQVRNRLLEGHVGGVSSPTGPNGNAGGNALDGRKILRIALTVVFAVLALFSLLIVFPIAAGDMPPSSLFVSIVLLQPLFILTLVTAISDYQAGGWTSARVRLMLSGLMLVFMIAAGSYSVIYNSGCSERVGPGAPLAGCSFERSDFTGRDLRGANLVSANLKRAVLRKANLAHANLNGAVLTGVDLTDASLDGAILDRVNLVGATGLTDEALASAAGVGPAQLAAVTTQKQIRLEERDAILNTLKAACTGVGVRGTHVFLDDKQLRTLVVLDAQGNRSDPWGDIPVRNKWEPMALRFTELVACIEPDGRHSVQTCGYSGGPAITRYQHRAHVRVVVAASGRILAEDTLQGSVPDECPTTARVSKTTIDGSNVTRADVTRWLSEKIKPTSSP